MKRLSLLRRALPALLLIGLLAACAASAPETAAPAPAADDAAPQDVAAAVEPTPAPPTATSPISLTEQGSAPAAPADPPGDGFPALLDTPLMHAVLEAVAGQIGVAPDDIEVVLVEVVAWEDGSLGCPQAGMTYAVGPVPGYRLLLQAGGDHYEYHLSEEGGLVGCAPAVAESTAAPEATEPPAATEAPPAATPAPTGVPATAPPATDTPVPPAVTLAPIPVTLAPLPITLVPFPTPTPTSAFIPLPPITLIPIFPTP